MKNVIVHAILAVVGLLWAYRVWTTGEEEERPETEVEMLSCSDSQFQRVELQTKHKSITLQQRKADGENYVWIQSHSLQNKKPANYKEYAGNQAAKDYINEITPLRALRSLGKIESKALVDLGLKDPQSKLLLKCNDKTHTLNIGGSTFGSSDRYVRVGQSGPVYLVKADLVQTLESAETRLMQRDTQAFKLTEIDEIKVTVGKKTRVLLHRDRRDTQQAQWVDKAKPDQRNELYGNWLRTVESLKVSDYLDPKSEPGSASKNTPGGKSIPVLSLTYIAEGALKGTLEIVRVDGPTPEYYAMSGATHAWVRLVASSAKRVIDDAAVVVGSQAAPPASSAPLQAPPALQSSPPNASPSPLPFGHP